MNKLLNGISLNPILNSFQATVKSLNEYALFVSTDEFPEIDCFLHSNDLTFSENSEIELKKYKVGDKIDVKILQIQPEEQKIRVSHRANSTRSI